ncbi:hypothetical protein Pse7367_3433 [Thalassoporum mexicanum PCC 7367]|uniref:DUF2997 domain-containing protein n=1 Tax=Thalassoporum mexicanum TaxID=3457544 RepID=UPI00029FB595|nr:DUF2997 domain-containing protein [Pseudanabaena sp. PCC 7367]AFY71670.1 hypothetical protein Pse7367_3433 [Pseudanabaena sp. PCC 7367]
MAEYQRIEYIIGKDGKVTEKVIDGAGSSCISSTASIEADLGQVSDRQLLPEYYEELNQIDLDNEETQYTNQYNQ